MIYDLYLTGMGAKTIAGKMVEMKRKKADGTYNWEHLSVLRILNNKTYEVDVLDELNLNCNEVEIPDNNFFYIVIKGKKHPMKKKKRWYSYDIILPENGGRIYVIYCMYEEHLRDIGVI